MAITTKTLKVRIKDKHARVLREWSRAVNFTWNYIIVGDVASAKLVKTKMAKSTLDAGMSVSLEEGSPRFQCNK